MKEEFLDQGIDKEEIERILAEKKELELEK